MDERSSPGADRAKRSRASKPKVKTGCLTCKTRRVKCDETKPSCVRCQKFGHRCDGYSMESPSKKPNPNSARTLVPRSPTLGEGTSSSAFSNVPFQTLSQTAFQNEHEHLFFGRFCSQTSLRLPSYFDKEVWNRLMLQWCESSPSVRQAILAIGALNLSSSSALSREIGASRHQSANRQRSRDIDLVRRDAAGGQHFLKTTLMACLLFYCFDSFPDYHDLTVENVYTGLKITREWTTSFLRHDQARRLFSRTRTGFPETAEDDVFRAFGNLEAQVMDFVDERNANLHRHYCHQVQTSIDEMPHAFRDLPEARGYLDVIIQKSMHWLRSTMHVQNFTAPCSPSSSPACNASDTDLPTSLRYDLNPTSEDQTATLQEYSQWDKAFQPLLTHARSRSACQETFLHASTLRLLWLSGYLSVAAQGAHQMLATDVRFKRELEELIGIARLLDSEKHRGTVDGVAFEMPVLVPLMTLGWACRNRVVRRLGVEMMLRCSRRAGAWDGGVVGKMMAWLVGIEEEGLEARDEGEGEGYVPESVAVRYIRMCSDTEKREAYVSCLKPMKGSTSVQEIKREVTIPW